MAPDLTSVTNCIQKHFTLAFSVFIPWAHLFAMFCYNCFASIAHDEMST